MHRIIGYICENIKYKESETMSVSKQEYAKMVKKSSPNSHKIKDFLCAYTVGGTICVIGQLLKEWYTFLGLGENVVKMAIPVSLIFMAVFLTALRVFDNIAKHAGAGTLVPITGFANAVASPAIEFKNEGYVLGVGANMFKIAGPVIVYGTVASVIYGIIYWITTLF